MTIRSVSRTSRVRARPSGSTPSRHLAARSSSCSGDIESTPQERVGPQLVRRPSGEDGVAAHARCRVRELEGLHARIPESVGEQPGVQGTGQAADRREIPDAMGHPQRKHGVGDVAGIQLPGGVDEQVRLTRKAPEGVLRPLVGGRPPEGPAGRDPCSGGGLRAIRPRRPGGPPTCQAERRRPGRRRPRARTPRRAPPPSRAARPRCGERGVDDGEDAFVRGLGHAVAGDAAASIRATAASIVTRPAFTRSASVVMAPGQSCSNAAARSRTSAGTGQRSAHVPRGVARRRRGAGRPRRRSRHRRRVAGRPT